MLPLVVPDTSPGPLSTMAAFDAMATTPGKTPYPLLGGPAHGSLVWFKGEPPDCVRVPDPQAPTSSAEVTTSTGVKLGIVQFPQFARYELRNFEWGDAMMVYYEWPRLSPEQRKHVVSCWVLTGFLAWRASLDNAAVALDVQRKQLAECN